MDCIVHAVQYVLDMEKGGRAGDLHDSLELSLVRSMSVAR